MCISGRLDLTRYVKDFLSGDPQSLLRWDMKLMGGIYESLIDKQMKNQLYFAFEFVLIMDNGGHGNFGSLIYTVYIS